MKNYTTFIKEKSSPYKEETLQKYKEAYDKGETIPFGVKTSLIAQGMIPHEGGPNKGKKKKTSLYEASPLSPNPEINVDQIVYGNAPIEYVESAKEKNDKIKNWFIQKGLIEKIKEEAPSNSSDITKNDLIKLLEMTEGATEEELTFARYIEDESSIAQSFIDILAEAGYEEDMGGFFRVDGQTDSLLFYLKDVINRPRPYQLSYAYNIPLYPLIRSNAMTASYPSGHALTGFVMAEYYAKKYPEIAAQLRAHGDKIAHSREVTGIHYPSDTAISKKICEIICENNLVE